MDGLESPLGLDLFVAIVEAGSISEAARGAGEARATVSRRLSRLEEHLGVRLLHRTTRAMTLTRAGEELYHRARRIVSEVRDAEQALRRMDDVPRGPLRITIPPAPSGQVFGPVITRFLALHPDVIPEIVALDRRVDLVREGFDVALRASLGDGDPTLVRRVLLEDRAVATASPAYLAAHGTPRALSELAHHRCIASFGGGDRPRMSWPRLDGGEVRIDPRAATNDLDVGVHLAVAGVGIAVFPQLRVAEELASGALVPVLEDVIGARTTLAVVYPERRWLEPQVRAFVEHVLAWDRAIVLPRRGSCAP